MKRASEGPRGGRMASLPQIRVRVSEREWMEAKVREAESKERPGAPELTLSEWMRRRLREGMVKK